MKNARISFRPPVVVWAPMMMNESVASDCCYCMVTEGFDYTMKVLNGGTIKSSKSAIHWSKSIVKAFGFADEYTGFLQSCPHYYKITYKTNKAIGGLADGTGIEAIKSSKSYYVPSRSGEGILPSNVSEWDGCTETCAHLSADCPWVSTDSISKAHNGSLQAHAMGGVDWAMPHKAYQYNS